MNQKQEEQIILKEKLKEKIICPILPDDEKNKIIDEIIEKNPIDKNKNMFNNLRQLTFILNQHLQKTYFPKSPIFTTEEQKIIMLYLSKKDDKFYSEEEIRKILNVYSGKIYQTIAKLKKEKKESLRLFPKYQKLLKERINNSKQQKVELTEEDINLLGYYIGEINYICLDISEIAKLKEKTEKEIIEKLTKIFNLLEEKENLDKILKIYPKREEMLKIKAKTLGINLKIDKKEEKDKSPLSEKQQKLLTFLNDKTLSKKQIAKTLNYRNINSLNTSIYRLKKEAENNIKLKEEILRINPTFFDKKKTKKRQSTKSLNLSDKQKKLLALLNDESLSENQIAEELNYKNLTCLKNTICQLRSKTKNNSKLKEEILKINPTFFDKKKTKNRQSTKSLNLSDKQKKLLALLNDKSLSEDQIAEELNYKNLTCLKNTIYKLRSKSENNSKLKEEILKINPTFFDKKKQNTKSLNLSDKQKKLLALLNDESLSKSQIAEELNYKNQKSLQGTIYQLKRKTENNVKLKKEVLKINPNFFKQEKEKQLLNDKQKELIILLNNQSLTRKQILNKLEYTHLNSLNCMIYNLRKKAETNPELKKEILKINPTFFNKKTKEKTTEVKLTKQELTLLTEIYQITPPETAYQTKKTIAEKLKIPYTQIEEIKEHALKKTENPNTKKQLLKIWPSFIEDKIIKENYRTKNRIIINENTVKKIKSYVRQYDIPESDKKEEKSNAILHGIKNLEESIFKPYVEKCSMEQKAILALRLGYFNYPLNSKNIADIFHIEEQEVITLTKKCLEESRPQSTAKEMNKTKIKKFK